MTTDTYGGSGTGVFSYRQLSNSLPLLQSEVKAAGMLITVVICYLVR